MYVKGLCHLIELLSYIYNNYVALVSNYDNCYNNIVCAWTCMIISTVIILAKYSHLHASLHATNFSFSVKLTCCAAPFTTGNSRQTNTFQVKPLSGTWFVVTSNHFTTPPFFTVAPWSVVIFVSSGSLLPVVAIGCWRVYHFPRSSDRMQILSSQLEGLMWWELHPMSNIRYVVPSVSKPESHKSYDQSQNLELALVIVFMFALEFVLAITILLKTEIPISSSCFCKWALLSTQWTLHFYNSLATTFALCQGIWWCAQKWVFSTEIKTTRSDVELFMGNWHLVFISYESILFMFTAPCSSFGAKMMDFGVANALSKESDRRWQSVWSTCLKREAVIRPALYLKYSLDFDHLHVSWARCLP